MSGETTRHLYAWLGTYPDGVERVIVGAAPDGQAVPLIHWDRALLESDGEGVVQAATAAGLTHCHIARFDRAPGGMH